MGARGPLPALRVVDADVNANVSHRPPKRTAAGAFAPGAPAAPASLGKAAKAEWRRVVGELDKVGLVAKVDRAVLTLYCEAWQWEQEAQEALEMEGFTVRNEAGSLRPHPAWTVRRDASAQVERLAKELLFTPTARLRASLPEGAAEDDAAGILD